MYHSDNIIPLMLENILEQPSPGSNSTSTKLNFLQSQKQELSELIDQLNTSIRINKETISKMAILTNDSITLEERHTTFNEVIGELNGENQRMRDRNQKLIEQIQARECKLLIQNQVQEETESEFVVILRQYEDKILELRRSLQDKEFLLQERETAGSDHKRSSNYIEPKQEIMKLHSENSETRELLKKALHQNQSLREQNQKLTTKNLENQFRLNKLEGLLQSGVAFCTVRELYNGGRRSLSAGKISLRREEEQKENIPKVKEEDTLGKTENKGFLYNSSVDSYYARNQLMTTMRKIIFKLRLSENLMKKEIHSLQQESQELNQTNKLLRESNIQHQIDRQKLQSEINFLKYKNHQLTSLITQRRGQTRRSSSTQNLLIDTIVREAKPEIVPVQDRKQVQYYFANTKYQLSSNLPTFDANISRNYFKSSPNRMRSLSSTVDYLPKAEVDGVQKYLNKKNTKQNRQEESKVDQFPFSIDYSVIENKSSPLTFADYRNKIKNKKFTESFMMITEEILKM